MSRIRLGIVGAGHLGRIHARLAAELDQFEIVAIADPDPLSLRGLASELSVTTVHDHCELIGKVDAAVVAAPSTLHHQVATELLDAGVHLLVEKPIAISVGEADEMVAMAEERHLVLQVGHVERFNPAFTAALPYMDEPVFIEASRCFLHSLRSLDIGVVHDLMIHDIDLILSLASANLQRVDAIGGTVVGPREDMAQAWLSFTNGLVANLKASRVSVAPERKMTVYCRNRVVAIDFSESKLQLTELSESLDGRGVDVQGLDAEGRRDLQQSLLDSGVHTRTIVMPMGNAIRDELVEFAACVATGATPRVCGRAGRNAVDVAELVSDQVQAFQQRHALPARPAVDLPAWRKAG